MQMRASWIAVTILVSTPLPSVAQWSNLRTRGIPRTRDGKPDLTSTMPRRPDGKPDLSGIWQADKESAKEDLASHFKPGEFPIQSWAEALSKKRQSDFARDIPTASCLPAGIPLLTIASAAYPLKIIQEPDLLVILYEWFGELRQLFLDGRTLSKDPNPTWLGYSSGRWDGDALVVDTTGFNGKTWLDSAGHPATDALHITERYSRRDVGHLDVELTIDDRKAYTKPWTVTLRMQLLPDTELMEFVCNENERDLKHSN